MNRPKGTEDRDSAMSFLVGSDWHSVLIPDTPLLEIFVRGSIMYLVIFALLRFVLKREAGTIGLNDLLVLVLVADAAQNAMAANYTSISDGVLLVGTIFFWSYTINWFDYRFPRFRHLFHSAPVPLVRDGQILYRQLRRELLTEDELKSQLRLQGIGELGEVKAAYMESDGRISVIPCERDDHNDRPKAPEQRAI